MNEKKWSLNTVVLYGINAVIGSGIFLLPGNAYKVMGPGSIFAYIFVLVMVMSIALCFAECGSMFEQSGGPYLYAEKAFGRFVGFEVGAMKWIVAIIAWATMAVAFATALSAIIPALASPAAQKAVAIGILAILTIVNLFGINIMAYLNNISTIGKLLPMAIFVVAGLFFLKADNFTPMFPNGAGMGTLSAAVLTVFYAFTGFENVGVAAGDIENPKKNVAKALIISMSIVSAVYLLVQINCIGILGDSLGDSMTPVADAFAAVFGSKGGILITIGTLISIGGINIGASFNTPRCAQGLAEGNLLPGVLAKSNKYHVPYIAVILSGVIAILLTLTGGFNQLAAISVISRFSQYIPVCLAVVVLRRKPEMKAEYRAPFGLLFPIIGTVASLWLLINSDIQRLIIGLGAMVIIAPFYFIMKKKNHMV